MNGARRSAWLTSALVASLLVACNNGTAPWDLGAVAGTYDLMLWSGSPMPSVRNAIPGGGGGYTVSGGTLTLSPNGTFAETTAFAGGGAPTTTGTYVVSGSAIVLHWQNFSGDPVTYSYVRRDAALVSYFDNSLDNAYVMRGKVSQQYSYTTYQLATYETNPVPYCTTQGACVTQGYLYLWADGRFGTAPAVWTLPAGVVHLPSSGTYHVSLDTLTLTSGTSAMIGIIAGSALRFDSLSYVVRSDPLGVAKRGG